MSNARKLADPNEFLEAFAGELRRAGVDVSRITTGVPILHPQIFSFSGLWELGEGTSERLYRAGREGSQAILSSPIGIAYEGGGPVRCDPTAPPAPGEFAILEDLRRDGYTDYVVHAVPFADGSFKALSLATRRGGGFVAWELSLFAVLSHGGEVLKFIGDAMLAIFPIGEDGVATCARALAAARRAQPVLAEDNRRREAAGLPRIDYGLALHVSDVIYGNIGSDTRLDFTVIGPAVNLTARIEALCRELGRQLLLSADFVHVARITAHSQGRFSLKGVDADQEIFAPLGPDASG